MVCAQQDGTLHQVGALTSDGWAVSCYLFDAGGGSHDCTTNTEYSSCITSQVACPRFLDQG